MKNFDKEDNVEMFFSMTSGQSGSQNLFSMSRKVKGVVQNT